MRICVVAVVVTGSLTMTSIADAARVRAVHASPDAPVVDIWVNETLRAIPDLAFGTASEYLGPLPAGMYNVRVAPAGQLSSVPNVIDADLTLNEGIDCTVVAIDTLASIRPLVLIDDNTIDPASARIRFVHASPNAPAVDIAVAGGGPVVFSNFVFEDSAYQSVPAGVYPLEVRLAGTDTVVLSLGEIPLNAGFVYSAFAIGLVGSNDTPLGALLTVDAIPTPGTVSILAIAGIAAFRRRRP